MTEAESLKIAREKLATVIEIYAPVSLVLREQALAALTGAVVEFEAAVRADAFAEVLAGKEEARRLQNDLSAAQAQLAAAPATVDPVGTDANGSPVTGDFVPPELPPVADVQDGSDSSQPEAPKKRTKK